MGGPLPRQLLRDGFSTEGSQLVLTDSTENQFYFDADGAFVAGKKKTGVAKKFQRDQAIAIVLNLSAEGPNANTVSLFCDGERISEPQAIPESMLGKPPSAH